jgi:hypothetical protein
VSDHGAILKHFKAFRRDSRSGNDCLTWLLAHTTQNNGRALYGTASSDVGISVDSIEDDVVLDRRTTEVSAGGSRDAGLGDEGAGVGE